MEIWKDIAGYEGLYQVSNLGRVKSLERVVTNNKHGGKRIVQEAVMQATDNGHGYKIVGLNRERKRKNFYVHRLVASAFVPNPDNLTYINHLDYDRGNNAESNLEWCTQKQNTQYSSDRMKKPKSRCKATNTGYKYIGLRNGRYRVCVRLKADKSFGSLEEALTFREAVLNGL